MLTHAHPQRNTCAIIGVVEALMLQAVALAPVRGCLRHLPARISPEQLQRLEVQHSTVEQSRPMG